MPQIPKDARILEIGCGAQWVGTYLKNGGWENYFGMDLVPPADIVGDITQWRQLGMTPESFDVIIAFEVIEHVDFVCETFDLLKPGGLLMLTSPLPYMDWALWILETLGLNQKRTSPHSNLVHFSKLPFFEVLTCKKVGGLCQWGILRKPLSGKSASRDDEPLKDSISRSCR